MAELLCLYAALSGLLALASGRSWLPPRRPELSPGQARRTGVYLLALGVGLGVEFSMIWVATQSALPARVVYVLASGGLLLAVLGGLFWVISTGQDQAGAE